MPIFNIAQETLLHFHWPVIQKLELKDLDVEIGAIIKSNELIN